MQPYIFKDSLGRNRLRITVLQEDIDRASHYDPIRNCIVATALKRKYGHNISCGFNTLQINGQHFGIPTEGSEKILDWTHHLPVDPFTFDAFAINFD
jgi:hypothetical protein